MGHPARERMMRRCILTPWIGEIVLGGRIKDVAIVRTVVGSATVVRRSGGLSGGRDEKRIFRDHPI